MATQPPISNKKVDKKLVIGCSIFAGLVLLIVFGVATCVGLFTTSATKSTPASNISAVAPVLIKEWSGFGGTTTESFTIDSNEWLIDWSSQPTAATESSAGSLQIMIHDAQNPDLPAILAANTQNAGSNTSYIHKKGTFYLTINAANTNWSIKVYSEP